MDTTRRHGSPVSSAGAGSCPSGPCSSGRGHFVHSAAFGAPERRQNVRGAFRAPAAVRGCVVLVDDVYTTGSTVSAAATALRAAGAASVEVVTFARAVRG